MPGFGRGPPLPGGPLRLELGRLPPPGRGGTLPDPAEPPDAPGRGVDERDGAEPPMPKGLLPTRGDRGPGFGPRGRAAVPGEAPDEAAPPSSGRGPGCCSAGGRCGTTAGRGGATGVLLAPGGSTTVGRSPTVGRTGPTRCSAAAGRWGAIGDCATRSGGRGTPAGATSGRTSGRRAGDGAGPGLGAPRPAGTRGPPEPALPLRPLADVPLAGDAVLAPEGNESRSLRATGASTVEEADFTYSPRSASFLRTSLLVTPSSFASSCTRALPATALLTDGAGGNPARPRY